MHDKIIVPRRPEDWFDVRTDRNGKPSFTFTLRAFKFFENLTETTNATTEEAGDLTGTSSSFAQLNTLQQQVGSGQKLTIDTTGFTVDTTFQFTDQTEA